MQRESLLKAEGADPLSKRVSDIFDCYAAGDFDQTTGPAYERAGIDPEINKANAIEAVLALVREEVEGSGPSDTPCLHHPIERDWACVCGETHRRAVE